MSLPIARRVWALYQRLGFVPPPPVVCRWWASHTGLLADIAADLEDALRNQDAQLLAATCVALLSHEAAVYLEPWT